MPGPNQSDASAPDVNVTANDLLDFQPEKPITEAGLRNNIRVGIQYLGAWLRGQRLRAGVQPDGGRRHRRDLALADLAVDPLAEGRARRRPQGDAVALPRAPARGAQRIRNLHRDAGDEMAAYDDAATMFEEITTSDEYVEFLTLPAYEIITRSTRARVIRKGRAARDGVGAARQPIGRARVPTDQPAAAGPAA